MKKVEEKSLSAAKLKLADLQAGHSGITDDMYSAPEYLAQREE
jgi:hypothetical protein